MKERKHLEEAAADEARAKARKLKALSSLKAQEIKDNKVGRAGYWANQTFAGKN